MGCIINPRIKLANICVNTEAMDAPIAPKCGIIIQFKTTFRQAPEAFIIQRYFCLLFASIQMFRIDPKYENVINQATIRKIVKKQYIPRHIKYLQTDQKTMSSRHFEVTKAKLQYNISALSSI